MNIGFGLHKDHPRFVCEALRDVAVNARREEAEHRYLQMVESRLADACALVASRLDMAATMVDPDGRPLDKATVTTVLACTISEMRAAADDAKSRGEHAAFDLYSDMAEVLGNAYERSQVNLAGVNGRQ